MKISKKKEENQKNITKTIVKQIVNAADTIDEFAGAGDNFIKPPAEIPLAGNILLASTLGRKISLTDGFSCPDYFDYSAIPDLTAGASLIFPDKLKTYPDFDLRSWLSKFYAVIRNEANLYSESLKRAIAVRKNGDESVAISRIDAGEDYSLSGSVLIGDRESYVLSGSALINARKEYFDYYKSEAFIDSVRFVPITAFRSLEPCVKAVCHYFRFTLKLLASGAFYPRIIIACNKKGYFYTVVWLAAAFSDEINKIVNNMVKSISAGLAEFNGVPLDGAEQMKCFVSFFISSFVRYALSRNSIAADNPVIKILLSPPASLPCASVPSEAVLEFNLKDAGPVPLIIKPMLVITENDGGFELRLMADAADSGAASGPVDPESMSGNDKNTFYAVCASLFSGFITLAKLISGNSSQLVMLQPAQYFNFRRGELARLKNFGIHVDEPAVPEPEKPSYFLALVEKNDGIKKIKQAAAKKQLINFNSNDAYYLSLGELLKFDWKVAIGDMDMTVAEFEKLVKNTDDAIVKVNGKYYRYQSREISELKKTNGIKISADFKKIMRASLTGEFEGCSLKLSGGASKIIERLTAAGGLVALPAGLNGRLREYQKRGYEWLYKNARLSMGSILADDMGLGKTVQVIALLLKLKEEGVIGKNKALAIVPTTLATTWVKEIKKFAPSLKCHIYHGHARELKSKGVDLLITTYGILRNDMQDFSDKKWAVIIADEAQNIKNPVAAQTQALKKIDAGIKIAVTGTPVENRLLDIWSIFDFVNTGYLGGRGAFVDQIARPVEKNGCPAALEKFKKMTWPFILRRLKTDSNVITDLPEKVEIDEFCSMTPAQTALYQKIVDKAMAPIKSADGKFARKGLILKLLTELKQVCNHPAQYLKAASAAAAKPEESGKMMTCMEILSEIINAGEKCLVFTQFVETGKMLEAAAGKIEGASAMFLHGQCGRGERDAMIEKFQNDQAANVFILSLRAGGTGINLTAASKVIHYDLWWNPAVEDQATGRAHRIGQINKVMVYRMITAGTFEEKIGSMLASKKKLAANAIEAGESWLGDLSDDELSELVKLEIDSN